MSLSSRPLPHLSLQLGLQLSTAAPPKRPQGRRLRCSKLLPHCLQPRPSWAEHRLRGHPVQQGGLAQILC